MQIGIDARMMSIPGGHGRYLKQLIRHLQKLDEQNLYTLFVLKKDLEKIVLTNPKWKLVGVDIKWYGFKEQIIFPKIIKSQKIDLMFFPHWNIPLNYHDPFIVAIHDLTLLHYPSRKATTLSPILYWIKQFIFKKVLATAVKNSQAIICPSDYVKNDIIKTFKIPSAKVHRIYEGVTNINPIICPKTTLDPYLLYVGVAYPHKNLENLVTAFLKYKTQTNSNVKLILAGRDNYFYKQLKNFVKKIDPQQNANIIFTGEVNDEKLSQLYSNAKAFAYISLSEGFGLPPLEALAQNIPVLASNTTCLPEILGNSALYVDPKNTEDIAQKINTILHNQETREQILYSSKNTLSKYNWETTAHQTLTIFQNNV